LALDESKESETIFTSDDFSLLADMETQKEIKNGGGVMIDHVKDPWRGATFSIRFANQVPGGCSGNCS
jgi:hypothetical protein